MTSRWETLSRAWSLSNLGKVAGEGLTALMMLRLSKEGKVKEDVKRYKDVLVEVGRIISSLIEEVKSIKDVSEKYKVPLDSLASPLLKASLSIYGIANSYDALKKLENLHITLDRIIKGDYEKEEVRIIEEFLEAILKVSENEIEQLTRFSEVLWKK